jgi:glucosamine--fructose-6-phosphate aminotransferase (isomerizing)
VNKFLQETLEIPDALSALVGHYAGEGEERLLRWASLLKGRREILFGGMGTSLISPQLIFPLLSAKGICCRAEDAGEWLHYGTYLPGENGIVILVSQSGESAEVRLLAERLRYVNPFVAITNDETSSLARMAALTFPLHAGDEASITTKTYVNTLALLLLMAAASEGQAGIQRTLADLLATADCLRSTKSDQAEDSASHLSHSSMLAVVGRGPAFVAAQQCALTFTEGVRCLTAGLTGGMFNHGPFETVGPELGLIIFSARGKTRELGLRLVERACALEAKVILITDDEERPRPSLHVISVKTPRMETSEILFPLAASMAQDFLMYHLAVSRNLNVGLFRYGKKVTDRE